MFSQQEDAVVARIEGRPIYKSEIEADYSERRIEGESIADFLDSHILMRLNILEAKALELDTTISYKRNYASFKTQLAKEYNKETVTPEPILKKIYERMTENLELNHYFIPYPNLDTTIFPTDTLVLYKEVLSKREELIKNKFKGKDCVDNTQLGSVVTGKMMKNGYWGWTVPFTLPLVVEEKAYAMSVGEVSMPIRDNDGYHILQVLNRRPAVGNVTIDQVIYYFRTIPPTQHLIDSLGKVVEPIYKQLKANPELFTQLCKAYTKEMGLAEGDCSFDTHGLDAELPKSFITAAFALKNEGDISPPVLSDYGYHFIKLKEKVALPEYKELRKALSAKVMNSDRSTEYTRLWRDSYFQKFGLSINEEVYGELMDEMYNYSPLDTLFIDKLLPSRDELFTISEDVAITVRDFASHLDYKAYTKRNPDMLAMMRVVEDPKLTSELLQDLLEEYAARAISAYADSTLETRVPEFGKLMESYAAGILLYDVKLMNVWNKAKNDDAGLAEYYKKHKKNYKWEKPKQKGVILFCKNQEIADSVNMLTAKYDSVDELIATIDKQFNKDSNMVLHQRGVWSEGDNKYVDSHLAGTKSTSHMQGYPFTEVAVQKTNAPADYRDVKAEVEADYQEELETKWTQMLRKKYKVEIDSSVLKTIK